MFITIAVKIGWNSQVNLVHHGSDRIWLKL